MKNVYYPNMIRVCCYNHIEYWQDRRLAMVFYREAINNSDGCEKERYFNVYMALLDGCLICTDGFSNYEYCRRNHRFLRFKNGTIIRDLNGEVSDVA